MKTDKVLYDRFRSWCELGSIGFFAPGKNPTQTEVNKAWEELHYYTVGQLDRLLSMLVGGNTVNTTKEASLKKLEPIISRTFGGVTLTEPKFISEARIKESTKAKAASLAIADQQDEDTHMTDIKPAAKKKAVVKPAKEKATAKVNVKDAKKSNPIATKSLTEGRRGRTSSISDDAKITLLVKENPKREGTNGYKAFQLYNKHKTVGSFLAAGGSRADLRYDEAKEFIKIK